MLVALDLDGLITSINRKGCEVLGRSENELIGQNWFKTCLPKTAEGERTIGLYKKIVSGAIDGREYYENHVLTSSGKECLIAWHNNILHDKDGEIIGTLNSGEDITERRRAEKEIHIKARELNILNKDLHKLTMELSRIEDAERKRFAEILHDDIGQKLVAIEMGILVAIRSSDDDSLELVNKLKDANMIIRGTIDSIREMSSDLYPVNPYEVDLLGKKGLAYATNWYVKNVLSAAGLKAEVSIDNIVDSEPYDFKQSLYRILQECFQNAMKHSSASLIKVKCDVDGAILRLSVEDDGTGFSNDEPDSEKGGVGLRLMRERVKDLNGVLTINSRRGKGTEVIAEFPLGQKEESRETTAVKGV
jgi:PAS domain S-box-containing protein